VQAAVEEVVAVAAAQVVGTRAAVDPWPARSAPVSVDVNVPAAFVLVTPCTTARSGPEVASVTVAVTHAPSW
jgi:hypothetical protein